MLPQHVRSKKAQPFPRAAGPARIAKGFRAKANLRDGGRRRPPHPLARNDRYGHLMPREPSGATANTYQYLPCAGGPLARGRFPNARPTLTTNRACYHHCQRKDSETQSGLKPETCHTPKPCFFHDIMGLPFSRCCHQPDASKTFGHWPV